MIIHLSKGLGNQMFQYAFGKCLEKKGFSVSYDSISTYSCGNDRNDLQFLNTKFKECGDQDLLEISVFFGLPNWFSRKGKYWSFFNKNIYTERKLKYIEDLSKLNKYKYLKGYWQSYEYFNYFRSDLLSDFTLKNTLSTQSEEQLKLIESSSESVSVHIRRGDYTQPKQSKFHAQCNQQYYEDGINEIKKNIGKDISVYVFSDDPEYAAKKFNKYNFTIIYNDKKKHPFEDILLMSKCKHNIIANSSFSWWGAYLNNNTSKIVIAPNKWYINNNLNYRAKQMIPSDWRCI